MFYIFWNKHTLTFHAVRNKLTFMFYTFRNKRPLKFCTVSFRNKRTLEPYTFRNKLPLIQRFLLLPHCFLFCAINAYFYCHGTVMVLNVISPPMFYTISCIDAACLLQSNILPDRCTDPWNSRGPGPASMSYFAYREMKEPEWGETPLTRTKNRNAAK